MKEGGRKGKETDGELDRQSEEERGNEFLAARTPVSISRVCWRKHGLVLFISWKIGAE